MGTRRLLRSSGASSASSSLRNLITLWASVDSSVKWTYSPDCEDCIRITCAPHLSCFMVNSTPRLSPRWSQANTRSVWGEVALNVEVIQSPFQNPAREPHPLRKGPRLGGGVLAGLPRIPPDVEAGLPGLTGQRRTRRRQGAGWGWQGRGGVWESPRFRC